MTVDEVTAVNVVEEDQKEDLSNGVNEKTVVKGEIDGDGDYVFVNGNNGDNGDPAASDLEKNGIGEVKSKSDSDESRVGIVDQDKESVELFHVEAPVDEQKSVDLLESGPVSETSVAVQNGVSDLPADDSVKADGLDFRPKENEGSEIAVADDCSDSAVTTVSEVNVLDSSAKEDEVSEIAVADNGLANDNVKAIVLETSMTDPESLADDGVEDNVLDFRSKENEDSEVAVADDADYNANDSAKSTISETSMTDQNGVSESTTNDIVEDNTLDFRSKENEGSEMAVADEGDCNGDGLANDTAEVNVTEANGIDSRSIGNVASEMAVAEDDDCNGDALASDSTTTTFSEVSIADQNGVSEPPVNGSAKTTVSEISIADQNGVCESPANDSVNENEGPVMSVADHGDCNGDGLANDNAEATVSEANVIDFKSIENEGSEMAVADDVDCNRNGLANDSVKATISEANALDSRSQENEGSEIVVADDGDCNGDGLTNGSAKATLSEANVLDYRSKENSVSEMAVADDGKCNGVGLTNDSAKATVPEAIVLDFRSKESEASEMAVSNDCNGDGLANDSAKATVSEAAVSTKDERNEVFELPLTDDGVAAISVSDNNGDCLPDDSEKETVAEAVPIDSGAEQNESSNSVETDHPGPVSNGNGDMLEQEKLSEIPETVLPDVVSGYESVKGGENLTAVEQNESSNSVETDHPSPVSNGNGDMLEQEKLSEIPETVLPDVVSGYESVKGGENLTAVEQNESSNSVETDHPSPVSNGNGDMLEQEKLSEIPETVLPDVVSGYESVKGGENLTAADESPVESGSELEHNLEKETDEGSLSGEYGEALQDVHTHDGIPETVQINESDDSSLNSQQGQSSELVENFSPRLEHNLVEGSSSTVILNNIASVESAVSDATAETFPQSSVDNVKLEADVIKSDEHDRVGLDSYHVDNLEIDVKVESGSIDDNAKSRCVVNGDDSIVSEEAEVSKVLVECHSTETDEKLVAVVDVQNDSNLVATVSNDEKAPAAVESVIRFGSVGTSQELEGLDEVEKKSPFYFLIKVPRYDDENLKEKVRLAQISVDEKTQSRDVFRTEIQKERASCKKYGEAVDAAISQERAIRDLHRSKRQEIDSIQSMMNIEDIDATIRNMEHMIQHETMPLKDEKQYIHQIKQYKQTRERISSNMGRQDEVKQDLDQIKERMKSLKKEADQLKVNLVKAEAVTKAAKKEYHDESDRLNKLLSQFKAADDIRQEAYVQLLNLKKESYQKNKDFYQYKDDAKAANDLALKGDKEALQNLCVNQVEKLMDLWNNNDEFRKEYIRCNVISTLRRLRTFDGRALGPDEEPPVIPPRVVIGRVAKDHSVSSSTVEERTQEKTAPAKAEAAKDKAAANSVMQKNQKSKSEKPVKPVPPASGPTTASSRDKIEESEVEKPKLTKKEEEMARKEEEMAKKAEEMARKAEELRKEEEAAKLREQRRLEEITKAKEALERKRRNAEKAQARAALRAQKEAEHKEKEREKRAKKKERRKEVAAGGASVTDETEPAPTLETPAETPKDAQIKEKPVTVTKRSQKPSQFTKQTKVKSVPPPLRIRNKRKMQTWMWVLLTCLVILALFLVGNYNFSFNFGLLKKFKF